MGATFAWAMAEAASAHKAATATREDTSQQRAGRTRRTSADPQRAQQGTTAAAAAAPAALATTPERTKPIPQWGGGASQIGHIACCATGMIIS